ncbi:MAG: DMT family transporter [Inhella sp.]
MTAVATTPAATRPWLVHLKLLGMAGLWGAAWPAGKVVASQAPALSASSWRFALSLLLLLGWLLVRSGAATLKALTPRQWAGLALGGALGVFGYAAFFLMGLQHLPAGRAALVVTTNPVLTLLLAAWLLGERLNTRIALGMVLAVGGATVVLTHGKPWTLFTGGAGIGEALLLGCVLCWSGYTLLGKKLLGGIDALTTTTVTAGFGLALLLLTALAFEPGGLARPAQLGFEWWAALLFMVVGSTVLAYAWYFEGVAALGAGAASAYISLVPVFGVAIATVWLGEAVDASLLAGGALVLAGMVVMNKARR